MIQDDVKDESKSMINRSLDLIHQGKTKDGIDLLIQLYKSRKDEDALSLIMQYSPEMLRYAVGDDEAVSIALYFADNKRYNLCMKILEEIDNDLGTEARVNCFLKANEINLAWNEVQKFRDPSMRKVGEGIINSWLGKKEEAKKLFQESLSLNGRNQEALLNLAMLEIEKGDYLESMKYVEKLDVLPDEMGAELCDKLTDGVSLLYVAEKWLKSGSNRVEVHLCLSKAYDLQGNPEKAIDVLEGVYDWRASLFKGVLLEKQGKLRESLSSLMTADAQCKHSQSEIVFEIALVLFKLGEKNALEKAKEALEMARNSKNGVIQALSCGLIYKITGDLKCSKGLLCANKDVLKKKLPSLELEC